ncbi:DUF4279 domain-containing protein [Burkholderia multivorans]|uniref:DUF4279 domain-containing protein n=1 Tax=Burkholderia multivorans TaxID=87883 RepID=UPI001C22CBFC|nr:DUF4279 domain-containing protein [Burkholderia multivorans]MBU9259112.1 DUF4279 domain-containing protein [Burkholderia multivorans]
MKKQQLAHASFSISGDRVVPSFWTHYFHVVPDTEVTKGERVNDPTGQGRLIQRRTSVWAVRSDAAVQSDQLEPHLRYLIKHLALPRPDLRELIENAGARVRIRCYWDNESGERVPDVPNDIRALVESIGGVVEIDEYR